MGRLTIHSLLAAMLYVLLAAGLGAAEPAPATSTTDAPAVPAATPAAATAPLTADEFLAKVAAGAKDIATVRLPFTQEKHLAIMEEPIISAGVIEISKPQSAVRWEFTGKSVLIFANGKIRRWGAEGKEEASGAKDPNLKSFQDQMQAFVSGDWSGLKKAFDLEPDATGKPTMIMKPKSKDLAKYIDHIQLTFRDDFTAPARMSLVANGGDETTYVFSEPQTGIELPAARFAGP